MTMNPSRPYIASLHHLLALVIGFAMLQTMTNYSIRNAFATETENVKISFVVSVPKDTPKDSDVFMAGSITVLGPWQPNALKLTRGEDNLYRTTIEVPSGAAFEYKFTRGSWSTVEKNEDGSELTNRQSSATSDTELRVSIAKWAVPEPVKVSTATGDIRSIEIQSDKAGGSRRITVWLPPQYKKNKELRLPVLYILDGQNVFDSAKAAFGTEWQADETADKLIANESIPPILIVAIDNSKNRIDDYTPTPGTLSNTPINATSTTETQSTKQGGAAATHLAFIIDEVKPLIDRTFRTKSAPDDTAIAGSSLGGLFSLYAWFERPDVFGHAICMSPSLFWDNASLLREVEQKAKDKLRVLKGVHRIWIDMGSHEGESTEASESHVARVKRLEQALTTVGPTNSLEVRSVIATRAKHNEEAWAKRLPDALQFIFGATSKQ